MNGRYRDSPQNEEGKASPRVCRELSNDGKWNQAAEAASPVPTGCCRGFSSVRTSASTSQRHHDPHHSKRLQVKVGDLEKEVKKQTELRVMYKKRMERTQEYLRYCLEVAQENGILDLILHNKGQIPQSPSPADDIDTPSSILTPPIHHSDLDAIIHQAKFNGWYIDPAEIRLQEKIGEGSTAEIYRGTWRGYDVAVKCINEDFFYRNDKGVEFFAQEIHTLSRQRHRFVLQLMGACLHPPKQAWLVTDYLGCTLKDWLHGPGKRSPHRTHPLPPLQHRLRKALEISQAMQYLHQQKPKVIHRDLKPTNIFLDDGFHVRVADFGHARFLGDHEMALTGETGTYVYMAPEVIRCQPYNEKCDVFSFGVILNELLTANYPYIENSDYGPTKIAMEVVEGKLRPMLPQHDEHGEIGELVHVITLCWDADPSIRPPFATITRTLKSYLDSDTPSLN